MSDRLFERAVTDWLESGSDRTPPAAIDAVLLAVKTTPQARRGPFAPRRFFMIPRSVALLGAIVVLAIGGFAVLGGGHLPVPSASPIPSVVPTAGSLVTVPPGQLVYDRFTGGGDNQYVGTFISTSNGSGERALVVAGGHIGGLQPIWAPDGRQLLILVCHDAMGCQPGVINADGTGFHALNETALHNFECTAWSSDARTVLCDTDQLSHDRDGIYRIGVDGTGLTELTVSPYFDTVGTQGECGGGDNRAVFSPDNTQFVFIRQQCGLDADPSYGETGALMIANADGSGIRQLVAQGGVNTHFGSRIAWSPDGAWIAFGTTSIGASGEIEMVKPDGSGLKKVVASDRYGSSAVGPVWSPNGTAFMFSAWDSGRIELAAENGTSLGELSGLGPGNFNLDWGVEPKP